MPPATPTRRSSGESSTDTAPKRESAVTTDR